MSCVLLVGNAGIYALASKARHAKQRTMFKSASPIANIVKSLSMRIAADGRLGLGTLRKKEGGGIC
jgi:uncharacterized membrane protein YsdA (DUF1294 family)